MSSKVRFKPLIDPKDEKNSKTIVAATSKLALPGSQSLPVAIALTQEDGPRHSIGLQPAIVDKINASLGKPSSKPIETRLRRAANEANTEVYNYLLNNLDAQGTKFSLMLCVAEEYNLHVARCGEGQVQLNFDSIEQGPRTLFNSTGNQAYLGSNFQVTPEYQKYERLNQVSGGHLMTSASRSNPEKQHKAVEIQKSSTFSLVDVGVLGGSGKQNTGTLDLSRVVPALLGLLLLVGLGWAGWNYSENILSGLGAIISPNAESDISETDRREEDESPNTGDSGGKDEVAGLDEPESNSAEDSLESNRGTAGDTDGFGEEGFISNLALEPDALENLDNSVSTNTPIPTATPIPTTTSIPTDTPIPPTNSPVPTTVQPTPIPPTLTFTPVSPAPIIADTSPPPAFTVQPSFTTTESAPSIVESEPEALQEGVSDLQTFQPILIEPRNEESAKVDTSITFRWDYLESSLPEGYGFELIQMVNGVPNGLFDAKAKKDWVRSPSNYFEHTLKLKQGGTYQWCVVVFQQPYKWSAERKCDETRTLYVNDSSNTSSPDKPDPQPTKPSCTLC